MFRRNARQHSDKALRLRTAVRVFAFYSRNFRLADSVIWLSMTPTSVDCDVA
jgi:hypothetical protein